MAFAQVIVVPHEDALVGTTSLKVKFHTRGCDSEWHVLGQSAEERPFIAGVPSSFYFQDVAFLNDPITSISVALAEDNPTPTSSILISRVRVIYRYVRRSSSNNMSPVFYSTFDATAFPHLDAARPLLPPVPALAVAKSTLTATVSFAPHSAREGLRNGRVLLRCGGAVAPLLLPSSSRASPSSAEVHTLLFDERVDDAAALALEAENVPSDPPLLISTVRVAKPGREGFEFPVHRALGGGDAFELSRENVTWRIAIRTGADGTTSRCFVKLLFEGGEGEEVPLAWGNYARKILFCADSVNIFTHVSRDMGGVTAVMVRHDGSGGAWRVESVSVLNLKTRALVVFFSNTIMRTPVLRDTIHPPPQNEDVTEVFIQVQTGGRAKVSTSPPPCAHPAGRHRRFC
jgi:hypothetical protein